MFVDIYRSSKQRAKFLAVPTGTVVNKNLGVTDQDFEFVSLFKSNVELKSGIIAIDPVQAKADILAHGYHIFGATVNFSIG